VQLRIAPWEGELQRVTHCALEVEPAVEVADHLDGFGNRVHRFAVIAPHERLVTRFRADVETLLANLFELEAVPPRREADWLAHSLHQAPRLWDFVLHQSPLTPRLPERLGDDALPAYRPGEALLPQVQGLLAWVSERYETDPCADPEARPLARLLEERCGAPAELAHLLLSILRGWGIPARFAHGYLDPAWFAPDDDADGVDAEPRPERLHPWAEVLIPGAGWLGFDPTHAVLADATYVRVAVGRDAGDVRTERSTYKGEVEVEDARVEVRLTRIP
jgi:transglutaminase-like putative cysteine protease